MNKRFLLSWLILTVATMALGFLVHGMLLADEYSALVPDLFRSPSDAEKLFPLMILADIFIGLGLTWIYRKGVEPGKSAVGQGVRFGLAVAVLKTIPQYLIYYVVQPISSDLAVKQIVFDVPAVVILGVLAALLNPAETR